MLVPWEGWCIPWKCALGVVWWGRQSTLGCPGTQAVGRKGDQQNWWHRHCWGALPTHTHKKRLYWAGYRETRICQPRLLARMKHSELSWLIIEFNPTLWGIKYIQSPPCYWHAGNSWRRCVQSCQRAENQEKHKHSAPFFLLCRAWRLCWFWIQILAPCKHVSCRHKVTDLLGSAAGCTAALTGAVVAGKPQIWRGWGSYTPDAHYDINSVKPFSTF